VLLVKRKRNSYALELRRDQRHVICAQKKVIMLKCITLAPWKMVQSLTVALDVELLSSLLLEQAKSLRVGIKDY